MEKQEEIKPAAPLIKKKKTLAEKIVEKEQKEKDVIARILAAKEKDVIARKLAAKEAMKNLSPEEKLVEKLRQQRLQEEADLQVTKEKFGVMETSESIDALQPTTQEEFNLLEEALTRKLQTLVPSVHYPTFVENLLRNIGAGMSTSKLKKLKLTIENLILEKVKVEKKKMKKETAKVKPRVRLEGKNDGGDKVEERKGRNPKIIFAVPTFFTAEELKHCVYGQNLSASDVSKEEFDAGFTPLFQFPIKDRELKQWVISCTPKVRVALLARKKLCINFVSCKVNDFVSVDRCFKCQGLGHTVDSCCESVRCAHCGKEGHNFKMCPYKRQAKCCANCMKAGKPHNHAVRDKKCPAYEKALYRY